MITDLFNSLPDFNLKATSTFCGGSFSAVEEKFDNPLMTLIITSFLAGTIGAGVMIYNVMGNNPDKIKDTSLNSECISIVKNSGSVNVKITKDNKVVCSAPRP
ncbi:MAG: hypothetical protein COB76_01250 [Alphaproteobacteria bacterium]|nr:MAG: hypothetical protein COB76_01250 [Alphaproteobacteria bacterium]